jgi:orotidine-5'-phosphate decarboxylase
LSKLVWRKLIVALDTPKEREIKKIVSSLFPKVKKFKVGLIPYLACGPKIVKWIKAVGADVFLDLKFFDIPNSMVEASRVALDMGVWAFTVHLRAGKEALGVLSKRLKEEAKKTRRKSPLIVGITELTSQKASLNKVVNLAKIAYESELDGVVCSVWEAKRLKDKFDLITITPGIRKAQRDDQKRIATPQDALREGVDYFVVGRPIIREKDYLKAAEELLEDLS